MECSSGFSISENKIMTIFKIMKNFKKQYLRYINRWFIAGVFIFLAPLTTFGIELKNWKPSKPPLKGTEELSYIELEEMANYSIAITYALDCGRFGDQLANYIKALWISWKYDLPLLYRPFDYSDHLKLSTMHSMNFDKETLKLFSKKLEFIDCFEKTNKMFDQLKKVENNKEERLLCVISFFTPMHINWVDFDDLTFRKILKDFIKPKEAIKPLKLPKKCPTVALHIRKGGGFDDESMINRMPTKFPADTFYLNGLKKIADHFKEN